MTGATHASIGAALGALIKRPVLSFLAGVVSHVASDAAPHRDLSPRVELALLAATMAFILARFGVRSPQFWGAVGGIAPDFEHALVELGLIDLENELFLTHVDNGRFHGPLTDERLSQILIFAASMLVADRAGDCREV